MFIIRLTFSRLGSAWSLQQVPVYCMVTLFLLGSRCVCGLGGSVVPCVGVIRRALGLLLSFPVYLSGMRGVFPVFDVGSLVWLVSCCVVILYVGGTVCVYY